MGFSFFSIWGGLGTFSLEITQKQAQFDHNVTVFSQNNKNELKQNEKWNGIQVFSPKTIELYDTFLLFANEDISSCGVSFSIFFRYSKL